MADPFALAQAALIDAADAVDATRQLEADARALWATAQRAEGPPDQRADLYDRARAALARSIACRVEAEAKLVRVRTEFRLEEFKARQRPAGGGA